MGQTVPGRDGRAGSCRAAPDMAGHCRAGP